MRWTLITLLVVLAGCDRHAALAPAPREVVYVVPYAGATAADTDRAAWAAAEATGRRVRVLPPRPLPRAAIGADRRLDAADLLDDLLLTIPADAFRIIGVTNRPLRAPEYRFVIGYARRGERAVVYSTSALPPLDTEAAHRRRVRRVITHELGHTYGAGHCDGHCLMKSTTSAVDIDLLPDHFCPRHRDVAERALRRPPDDPDVLAARARERMGLGRWGEAVRYLRRALARRPDDPRLVTSLGVALMANGELTAAEDAFEEAAQLAPALPQPYYARAVLYAAGYAPHRAAAYLEAAVERDGDPLRAHRAAGIVYQDLLEDPEQAVRHFEAHIRLGGRDPEVIARVVYLLAPATVVFEEPEVVVARWHPERGLLIASAVRPR